METIVRYIGKNRGKSRIWIEGKALAKFGWTKGTSYVQGNFEQGRVANASADQNFIGYSPLIRILKGKKANDASFVTEKRIAGTETRPIIDLCGNYVAKLFKGYKTVKILITTNSIEIKGNE